MKHGPRRDPPSARGDEHADGLELGDRLADLVAPRRNHALEQAVLGAVLFRWREAWPFVEGRLDASDFADPKHARIFAAICAAIARGLALDLHTLTSELGGDLEAVGGPTYLHEITQSIGASTHVEDWVRVLRETATLRRMQEVAVKTLLSAHTRTFDETLAVAAEMQDAVMGKSTDEDLVPAGDALLEMWDRIQAATARGGGVVGRSFGLRGLDALTGGASDGQLILICARPAMGKTSALIMTLNAMAHESLQRGEEGVYLVFSLEMPRVEIVQRHACQLAGVSESDIRHSRLSQDDLTALEAATKSIDRLPIHVADKINTLSGIRAACHRAKLKRGRVLGVGIDYLQLMRVAGLRKDASPEQEIGEVSRSLKQLAKELACPLLALSQLNRDCEKRGDKRPMLADIRGSGSLEQDADVVAFIYRDEVYDKNSPDRGIAEFIVAKQRSGPADTVRTRFIKEHTRFVDLDGSEDFAA